MAANPHARRSIDSANVTSIADGDALARARRRHITAGQVAPGSPQYVDGPDNTLEAERETLVRNCRLMKSVLFNAGKRLERKHAAGQFTFAVSGIYGFLVPLFTLQFEPFLTALVTYVVSFTAATAGAVSFVVAMLYQQQDLARRARRFYDAGRRINTLGKDVRLLRFSHPDELRRHLHFYDSILDGCENHDEIDFSFARQGTRPKPDERQRLAQWKSERRRLDIRFGLQTYGLVAVVWLVPPLIGLGIWFALSK